MPNEFRADDRSIANNRFAVIVSQYNTIITQKLHDAAIETLKDQGVLDENIDVIWVPGAWEIPLMASTLIEDEQHAAIICLGCVIKGETSHDQHINREVSHALSLLSLDSGLPVALGVLTCNTLQQAEARSGGNRGNKGVEATNAAIDMVRLLDQLNKE